MHGEYEPYQHVQQLRKGMAAVIGGMAAAMPKQPDAPPLTENADGSVVTRAGVQLRPPRDAKAGA